MKKNTPKLGQHFLTKRVYAEKLARAVAVRTGETILEIGPGTGTLTRELLATGAHVVAIEKDGALADELNATFAREIESGQMTVIAEDIRNFDSTRSKIGPYVVAANIPYYITGEIIRMFLSDAHQPRTMALLVQKEVAQRIAARDKKESILSISVKVYGMPKIVTYVPRGNFDPPPSVDSAILLIDDISRDFFRGINEKRFFEVVRAGFSSKRKLLAGNLKRKFGNAPEMLSKTVRAEDVSVNEWREIARLL